MHVLELNEVVSQSGEISLRATCQPAFACLAGLRAQTCAFVHACEQYYQLADVVAMGTNAAVMQRVSRRDADRLYYYTVSKIMGDFKFSVTE